MKDIYGAVIAGAGPAGISCALRCKELGVRTIIIEAGSILNTIKNYPKGKLLFGVPGFYKQIPKKFISLLENDLARAKIEVNTGESIEDIRKENGIFLVSTTKRKYHAKSVVLAFGTQGAPNMLGVPGEDTMPHIRYTLGDPKEFRSKKVLVVGGGDSAIEASVLLAKAGATVYHSYRRSSFFRAKEENVAEFRKSKAIPLFGTNVSSIGSKAVEITYADGKKESIPAESVFIFAGSKANTGILEKNGITLNKDYRPAHDTTGFETNIPGIYAIGDLAGTATILPALYSGFIIAPAILTHSKKEMHHA